MNVIYDSVGDGVTVKYYSTLKLTTISQLGDYASGEEHTIFLEPSTVIEMIDVLTKHKEKAA